MSTYDERLEELGQRLQGALAAADAGALAELLDDIHAADLAEIFPDLDGAARQRMLDALSDEHAAELLDELEREDRAAALDLISTERTSDILEEMPSDEAADLLRELPTEEADALLGRMEPELADDVADLLRYPEDTAGGLMVKEFVRVGPEETVSDVLALLRRHHDDAEMIYYLYVLDDDDRLLGVVTLRRLIISDPQAVMSDIMAREFYSVPLEMPQDEVAEIVRRHDLLAVPVLDDEGRMEGMITVDDIGDVVQEEAAEELLEMSGAESPDDRHGPRPWSTLRSWRSGAVTLAGGVLAAGLIWAFSSSLQQWSVAAILLPLLFLLGITAGSQSAISMDRAYDNAVERHQTGRIFHRELLAGAAMAVLGGLLAGLIIAVILPHAGRQIIAVACSMALGLWLASVTGAMGSLLVRQRGGWLRTTNHTLIVGIGTLLALAAYLLVSRWALTL